MRLTRLICLALLLLLISQSGSAIHIKGGWMYYEFLGKDGSGNNRYKLTLKFYRDCAPPTNGQNDPSISIDIYRSNNTLITSVPARNTDIYRLEKKSFSDCINPKPQVCYVVLEYEGEVTLPPSTDGYVAAFQRCCRVNGIVNVQAPSDDYGNTYTISLPGTVSLANAPSNNSPRFAEKDTVALCYNSPFELDYSAVDADNDSLVYSLTNSLTGGSKSLPNPPVAQAPPYNSLNYASPYSAANPFGTNITIDSKTGIITGTTPSRTGEYVLAVSAKEYRNGVYIAETRKELHISIAACTIAGAQLPKTVMNCDGYSVSFQNISTSSAINSYYWDFGDLKITTDTSTQPKPSYTYADTGTYFAKLIVNRNSNCADSAISEINVFPGFDPDFEYTGSCFLNPFQFNDKTTTKYGVVNSWKWNFGDLGTQADSSLVKNPSYKYPPTPGTYTVLLEARSNKGCMDTITRQITVTDKPFLDMAFRDTLICSIDSLQLEAIGTGIFSWSPVTRMIRSGTATPIVFPTSTTTYQVTLNELGCIATDTVRVNVLDFITIDAGNDTTICLTDSVQLVARSQGLQFLWSPSTELNNPDIRNPIAKPTQSSSTYKVTVNLGKCQAEDFVTVRTVPYPESNAGNDITICFGDTAILHGSMNGNAFTWTPSESLLFPDQLTTPAYPVNTTAYVLSVYADAGCPKPAFDTVILNVTAPIVAFAGNDTSIVFGQPLQLNGQSNATIFSWTPAIGMTNPGILDPMVTLGEGSIPGGGDKIRYELFVTTDAGCSASDDIVITLFKTAPSIFIPSAFTPNQDGKNDVFRPILAGMKKLVYFRIYNRYGQLVFETSQEGKGWDGKIKGNLQASNAFVYTCQAIDYLGKTVVQKGSFVLIK